MFFYLSLGFTLGLSAAVSPGPFQAFLLAQTLKSGWRRAILAAFAPLVSDGPIIVLVLLILTQTPAWFLAALQIAGGGFILYLAWGAFQVFRAPPTAVLSEADSAQQSLVKAVVVNALNPNPYIFWSTVAGPILLQAWRTQTSLALAFMGSFYGAIIGGFMGFVLLFDRAGRLGPRLTRWLNGLSAVLLLGFGGYQLGAGVARLLGLA